jgi:hypothetical protein
MSAKAPLERVAFSPGEFAALFGKQQTWGYRQLYAGKVKGITEHGRILIPASEVERILGKADRYEGLKKKPARTKEDFRSMQPQLQSAWLAFIGKARVAGVTRQKPNALPRPSSAVDKVKARREALKRLTRER